MAFAASLVGASLAQAKPLIPISPEEVQLRLGHLVNTPWDGKSTNKGTTEEEGCLMSTYSLDVVDSVTAQSKTFKLLVQSPKAASTPVPVVIIVPTIDGTRDELEPVVARSLCGSGIASIIADVNDVSLPKTFPAWGAEDVNNKWAMIALRTVVDFAQANPRFDKNKVGALGLSLGGITTAMFAGIEPRLKASVIVVGGGNFPFILSASDHWHIEEMRTKRMEAAGFTKVEQYEDKLRETITFDPFYFASQANRENVMMVMAENDVKVPYVVQREQWEAFGKPTSLVFTGGHVSTIIQMVYLYMGDVTSYFDKRFAAVPALAGEMPITHKLVDLNKLGL